MHTLAAVSSRTHKKLATRGRVLAPQPAPPHPPLLPRTVVTRADGPALESPVVIIGSSCFSQLPQIVAAIRSAPPVGPSRRFHSCPIVIIDDSKTNPANPFKASLSDSLLLAVGRMPGALPSRIIVLRANPLNMLDLENKLNLAPGGLVNALIVPNTELCSEEAVVGTAPALADGQVLLAADALRCYCEQACLSWGAPSVRAGREVEGAGGRVAWKQKEGCEHKGCEQVEQGTWDRVDGGARVLPSLGQTHLAYSLSLLARAKHTRSWLMGCRLSVITEVLALLNCSYALPLCLPEGPYQGGYHLTHHEVITRASLYGKTASSANMIRRVLNATPDIRRDLQETLRLLQSESKQESFMQFLLSSMPHLSPTLASGHILMQTFMDALFCQTIFNPMMLQILLKMLNCWEEAGPELPPQPQRHHQEQQHMQAGLRRGRGEGGRG
ncbi:hypothetical protein TSOC_012870 [Tetrabaena socialis]|uniref:Uncharacterized protein n=1 Tax=Tetrabaena socialis TaxID=47790 RepID=A0A2J7ZLW4_9CHLO|nr:hypothetical protein TSOC_012870 [Tetrabaena socialis]|eukprot:PNH01256.1 hypothetical protein TSOC_012870 [Tetrabaena socialis]